jgi:hypothetical protein
MTLGGPWRFLAFLVVYLAIYRAAGWVVSKFAGDMATDPLFTSVGTVFFQLTFGLIVGAIVLVGTSVYLGWTAQLFGRQPIYRSWWMWIAPVVVAMPILLRIFGIDWGKNALPIVVLMLLTGLMIGFVEELAYRGIGIKMLRDGGLGEWSVAALSSLFFSLSHATNIFSGQSWRTVGPTVIYTFAFGVLMYLTLRTIGFLIGAIILHGLTDPTTFLASGGIDEVTELAAGTGNGLLDAAGLFTFVVILVGFVLLIFIRGRVASDEQRQPESAQAA